jgi:hypothetical protein
MSNSVVYILVDTEAHLISLIRTSRDLEKNFITFDHQKLKKISPKLGVELLKFKELEVFDLSANALVDVPVQVLKLRLKKLYLQDNKLVRLLPDIGRVRSIRTLILNDNKLTELPQSIDSLVNLEVLEVGYNFLTDLTPGIGNCIMLKRLVLKGNKLKALPNEIGQLKSLEYFDCFANFITEYPARLTGLPRLNLLNFSNNLLSTLPATLSDNVQLQTLYLGRNKLSKLPGCFAHMPALTSLDLSYNKLTAFPPSLLPLAGSLQVLSLSHNRFDELPLGVGKMKALNVLRLEGMKMRIPPQEVVLEGTWAVVAFLKDLKQEQLATAMGDDDDHDSDSDGEEEGEEDEEVDDYSHAGSLQSSLAEEEAASLGSIYDSEPSAAASVMSGEGDGSVHEPMVEAVPEVPLDGDAPDQSGDIKADVEEVKEAEVGAEEQEEDIGGGGGGGGGGAIVKDHDENVSGVDPVGLSQEFKVETVEKEEGGEAEQPTTIPSASADADAIVEDIEEVIEDEVEEIYESDFVDDE